MLKYYVFCLVIMCLCIAPAQAKTGCGDNGVWLQVLGSGGPELDDGRASSGYLIWNQAKARILVDMGSGSLLHFEQSGASVNDLDVILFSHLHVDHSSDLPALVKASFFSDRDRDLPIAGPDGNRFMPSISNFLKDLFWVDGAYQYLNRYLDGTGSYRLVPVEVQTTNIKQQRVLPKLPYQLTAVPVHHGALPALAWRVVIQKKAIVFSGDMNNDNDTLAALAKHADVLVAHNAVPEGATGVARNLHMPPSVIGQIAAKAKVKLLMLSHRMKRTLGNEPDTVKQIRKSYQGSLQFAEDMQCLKP